MIRDIRDNNGRSYNLPMWKKGLLLFSAIFVFSSILTEGGAITSYAQDQTGQKGIQFNFKDTPIETVLSYLSEAAGLVVISENNLTDRITIISKQPLNVDDAVALINTILPEKGYTAVRSGKNLKIATLSGAKKLTIPVHTGSDPNAVTPSDDVMTYVIPITYAKAATLKDNLTSFLSENAEVGTNADTNTLIITDTANNIRRIMEIVRAIDTHTAAFAEVKVFHLQYADATTTATLITNLFKQSSSSGSNLPGVLQAMTRFGQAGGTQGSPGQGQQTTQSSSTQGASSTTVTAQADERTNSVVVSAPQDTMAVIDKMIKDLDSDSSQGEAMFVYRLKNGQASNLVTVLKNLFNSATNTTGTTASSQTTGRVATTVQAAAGPGGVQSMTTSTSSSTGLVGSVYVQADTDTNSLVVMTSPGNYEKVKKMLDELDKPVPQVLIKALIAEVTLDDTIDLGADFSFLNDWNNTNIQVNSDLSLSNIATGMVANLTGSKWTVQLKALEKEGKLNVLSKPYILATNNQKASITVGSQVPVITDSRTTDTGQTINTVTYEDLGIILTVTPAINEEGLVTMDVTQTISDISATTVQISTGVQAPVFDKRSSTNRVIARDGQTVVIGGLIQNKKSKTYSKIPLLGDIPLLGVLFRNADNQKTKTELLIFLTPTVAATDKDLEKISNDKKAENEFLKEKFSAKELEGLVIATPEKDATSGK